MKSLRSRGRWLALWGLALAALAPLQAQNVLTATPSSITLNCSTVTGPGPSVTVVVRPVATLTVNSTPIAVGTSAVGAGLVITAPSVTTLTAANQVAGLSYTVRIASGCSGAATGNRTFRFNAGANQDVTVTAALTVTAGTTSPLTLAPSSVSLVCTRTPGSPNPTYTPGPAVAMTVRSTTPGGTPFIVDNTTSPPPAWLTLSAMSGTATATAGGLSFSPAAGCGSFAAGTTNTATIRLQASPAPERLVQVSLQVVPPSPLTATPAAGVISYTKSSGTPGRLDILLGSASSPAPFMQVDTSSLPTWVTVDTLTGSVPRSIRFTTTAAADSMVPGTYSSTVKIRVANFADLSIPLTLQLNNPPPRLTISDGLTRNISWTVGTPLPTPSITAVSSDSPISYTIDTGGPLAPIVAAANLKGLAYNFGSIIPVTFNPNIFAAAQPGSTLSGTVSLTWGNPSSTVTVTFNVAILAPGAAITSISPASLPTAAPGQIFTLSLTGSSFVPSHDLAFRTRVGIVTSSGNTPTMVVDPSISVNVVNVSNMILTITVPASTNVNLPFALAGAGGTVILGVCNPSGTTCNTPTSTASFTIGSNPIIDAVTSASSFQQITAPAVQTVAPYDVLSIFGANFCSSGGRGCASSDILYGIPDTLTSAYPLFVSPDAAGATQRRLSVTFQTRATPPVVLGTGAILFATNNQINVMVPSGISAQVGNAIDMVVSFGYATGATMLTSPPYQLNVVAANPGLFTVAANGMGDGAVLNTSYALVSASNEAAMRSTPNDSDTVQIYMTGLGIPNSTADNASAGSAYTWSADCISLSSYLTSLNTVAGTSLTSADGLVLRSSLVNTNRLMPCFLSGSTPPTATIGGVAGTVTYAGLVADSFVGLYQVNVRLPGSGAGPFTKTDGTTVAAITSPVQLPVVVSHGGRSSQAGVDLWVRRKLKVLAPTTVSGAVGITWGSSNNAIVASQGTSPYRYAITSGLLPAGLTMNTATGAITGTPAANTSGSYSLTVTATDSANFPITGTVSFSLTVAGGLVVTASGTAPYTGTYGTANATLTTATATGGTFPYTYTLTAPSPLPSGLSIDPATGVLSISSTIPAGTYQVTITATDSSSPALTGTVNFDVVVSLLVTNTSPVAGANGTASTISTVSATGNTGAVTYALDTASAALNWLSINANTGVVSISNAAPASTTRSVTVTATAASSATGASAAGTGTVTFTVTIN